MVMTFVAAMAIVVEAVVAMVIAAAVAIVGVSGIERTRTITSHLNL